MGRPAPRAAATTADGMKLALLRAPARPPPVTNACAAMPWDCAKPRAHQSGLPSGRGVADVLLLPRRAVGNATFELRRPSMHSHNARPTTCFALMLIAGLQHCGWMGEQMAHAANRGRQSTPIPPAQKRKLKWGHKRANAVLRIVRNTCDNSTWPRLNKNASMPRCPPRLLQVLDKSARSPPPPSREAYRATSVGISSNSWCRGMARMAMAPHVQRRSIIRVS